VTSSTYDPSRFASLDLETSLVEPGILAPEIVCGSTATVAGGRLLSRAAVLPSARALLLGAAVVVGANIAYDFGCLAAEDPDLLPAIFAKYERGDVFDVQVAQALHAIADGHLYLDPRTGQPLRGRYSLERCVDHVLGRQDAKRNDFYRKRYAVLARLPVEQWPEEARQYPVDDAVNTLEVAVAQVLGGGAGVTPGPHRNLGDLAAQVETAFALHLGAVWGLRVDRDRYEALRRRTEEAHESFVARFRSLGFFRDDGREDQAAVRRAVAIAYGASSPCPAGCVGGKVLSPKTGAPVRCAECSGTGLDVSAAPKTAAGAVSADRDALVESGDPDLAAYGESEAEKVRDTYLPFLSVGVDRPLSLRPNVLVASGRTSYDGVIQQMPREGDARACFRARGAWSGSPVEYVYCSVDYSGLESCTLAQVCTWLFGRSKMAETINATGDPGALHAAFAASMMGRTTEEVLKLLAAKDENAKKYRQAAKAGNYGFPGGMGAAKFVLAKRKKSEGKTRAPDGAEYPGIRFCLLLAGAERCGAEKVTEWRGRPTPPLCRACVQVVEDVLRPAWFRQWPEMRSYFAWVTERVDADGGSAEFPCLGTERVRGGLDFTNAANNGFQALAADGAKCALRAVARECYLGVDGDGRPSPLAGARPIFFVHDEIIAELPEATAHLAGPRMAEVMVESMRRFVPDVCIKAEPALMRTWQKSAEPAYAPDGSLIPWDDAREAA
jgi:hypothetical protein